MKFIPIKTRAFLPPKDNIFDLLDSHLKNIKDGDIVFITSKVLAIHQGRCIKIDPSVNKKELVLREAERFVIADHIPKHSFIITMKDHTIIPSAGIDESNANGHYILWPKNTNKLLKEIWLYLRKKHKLKKLAVVATDSHTIPMRLGVVGISIGFFGMEPFYDYVGKPDIFGRKLKFTKSNLVDGLSAMAVQLMGEGSERIPIVVARDVPNVRFTFRSTHHKLVMKPEEDLYYPLLKVFKS